VDWFEAQVPAQMDAACDAHGQSQRHVTLNVLRRHGAERTLR
jgi:hypothetical protein